MASETKHQTILREIRPLPFLVDMMLKDGARVELTLDGVSIKSDTSQKQLYEHNVSLYWQYSDIYEKQEAKLNQMFPLENWNPRDIQRLLFNEIQKNIHRKVIVNFDSDDSDDDHTSTDSTVESDPLDLTPCTHTVFTVPNLFKIVTTPDASLCFITDVYGNHFHNCRDQTYGDDTVYGAMSASDLRAHWEACGKTAFSVYPSHASDHRYLCFFDTEWVVYTGPNKSELWKKVQTLTEIAWVIVDEHLRVVVKKNHTALGTQEAREDALFDLVADLSTYLPMLAGFNSIGFDIPALVHKFPQHPLTPFFIYDARKVMVPSDVPGLDALTSLRNGYITCDLMVTSQRMFHIGHKVSFQNLYKALVASDYTQKHTAIDDTMDSLEVFKAMLHVDRHGHYEKALKQLYKKK